MSLTQAAKGGAKSVINRNRRQRNRGGHGIGSNHGDDTLEGGESHLDSRHRGAHSYPATNCIQVCEFKCADKEMLLSLVRVTFDKLKKNIRMGKIANKLEVLSSEAAHNIFTCLSSLNYFATSHILGAGTVTGMGDFSKGPCVGVCYYIKKRGIKLDEKMKKRMKRRKPCIGLCHIKKMRQRRKEKQKNKENKEDI